MQRLQAGISPLAAAAMWRDAMNSRTLQKLRKMSGQMIHVKNTCYIYSQRQL